MAGMFLLLLLLLLLLQEQICKKNTELGTDKAVAQPKSVLDRFRTKL